VVAEPRLAFVDGEGAEVTSIRYGDAFAIILDGFEPGRPVLLESQLWGYRGWGSFVADDTGRIDTREHAPSEGSYDVVHPEGLLWSMVRESDASDPGNYGITVRAVVDGVERLRATLERRGLNQGLALETVSDQGLVGVLYKPDDQTGPLPGLIVLGGSEGGVESASFYAAWLAGYGYAALGLAYFDEPGLPDELLEVPMEYFETALAYLGSRPDIDASRIGVVGGSRGGELALILGARYPQIRAIVAEVPSGIRWGAVSLTEASAWSAMGMPLPYLTDHSGAQPEVEMLPGGGTGIRLTPWFDAAIDTAIAAELAAATIPVENSEAAVLMLAGDDDGIWPSCRLAQIAMDRLIAAGHDATHDDEAICFPDAGHVASMPGWPTTETYSGLIGFQVHVFGGTPGGNFNAQRMGLERIKSFLGEQLGSAP
jgi:dienelactone hydrolase